MDQGNDDVTIIESVIETKQKRSDTDEDQQKENEGTCLFIK